MPLTHVVHMCRHSAFLTWSAIRSNPDSECNDAAADSSALTVSYVRCVLEPHG